MTLDLMQLLRVLDLSLPILADQLASLSTLLCRSELLLQQTASVPFQYTVHQACSKLTVSESEGEMVYPAPVARISVIG